MQQSISYEQVVNGRRRLSDLQVSTDGVFWLEDRISWYREGIVSKLTPSDVKVRTKIHEYGGQAFTVSPSGIYFIAKEGIYHLDISSCKIKIIYATTIRYANLIVHENYIYALAESHSNGKVKNYIAAIDIVNQTETTLVEGSDFYACLELSPCRGKLAWISWSAPNMPWDRTRLELADIKLNQLSNLSIKEPLDESIAEIRWSPDSQLYYASDLSGWWNLYKLGTDKPIFAIEAEFSGPLWSLGRKSWDFIDKNTLCAAFCRDNTWRLLLLNITNGEYKELDIKGCDFSQINYLQGKLTFIVSATDTPARIAQYCLTKETISYIYPMAAEIKERLSCKPRILNYSFNGYQVPYLLFVPANSPDAVSPLMVIIHGGPTGCFESSLDYKVQFWVSRGFAVLAVNFSGSTGFGRTHRNRLNGNWGILDVDEVIAVTEHVISQEKINQNAVFLKGNSSGGYTAFKVLEKTNIFKAAAIYYGVMDLLDLQSSTHKFERHYLHSLIGDEAVSREKYKALSPINCVSKLNTKVIFFHGREDMVVPFTQTTKIVSSLTNLGDNCKLILFDDEGHGFKKPENIQKSLEEEVTFFLQ